VPTQRAINGPGCEKCCGNADRDGVEHGIPNVGEAERVRRENQPDAEDEIDEFLPFVDDPAGNHEIVDDQYRAEAVGISACVVIERESQLLGRHD